MNKFIIILLASGFVLGQIARIQIGNIAFTALDLAVIVSCVIWVARIVLGKKYLVGLSRITQLFWGVVGVGLVSLLLFSPHLSLLQFFTALLYPIRLLLYISLYYQARELKGEDRRFTFIVMLISGSLVVLLGFIQLMFYPALRNLYYLGWDEHLYRMFSTFLDPNFAGAFFVLFSLFAVDMSLRIKRRVQKMTVGGLALASFIAVFLTYSRTGFIMLIVGLAIYLLLYLQKKVALFALIACFFVLILVSNTKIEGLNPFRTASTDARLNSASHALAIIQKYPFVGVGFNAFRYAQVEMGYRQEYTLLQNHADAGTDNSYLFVLATTGILGGLLFIGFIFYSLRDLYRQARSGYFPSRSLFAGFVSVLVGTLFLNILFYPVIVGWLAVQTGLIRDK